jgi:hypothetical protein
MLAILNLAVFGGRGTGDQLARASAALRFGKTTGFPVRRRHRTSHEKSRPGVGLSAARRASPIRSPRHRFAARNADSHSETQIVDKFRYRGTMVRCGKKSRNTAIFGHVSLRIRFERAFFFVNFKNSLKF